MHGISRDGERDGQNEEHNWKRAELVGRNNITERS